MTYILNKRIVNNVFLVPIVTYRPKLNVIIMLILSSIRSSESHSSVESSHGEHHTKHQFHNHSKNVRINGDDPESEIELSCSEILYRWPLITALNVFGNSTLKQQKRLKLSVVTMRPSSTVSSTSILGSWNSFLSVTDMWETGYEYRSLDEDEFHKYSTRHFMI